MIKNGKIVTATDIFKADIGINNGKVEALGKFDGTESIDAEGKLILPGGIDVHTHLDMPFMGTTSSDDFETGTIAAAFGGTTSIIDFVVQPAGETLSNSLSIWEAKAKRSCIDYGFHMAMTDINDSTIEEMGEMVERGITSFKLFMAYKEYMCDDSSILKVLEKAKDLSALVMVHAENGEMIDLTTKKLLSQGKTGARYHQYAHPAIAEEEAVGRAIALAELISTPIYIVHLSCAGALEMVRRARARGVKVFAETCPQYLLLDVKKYEDPFEPSKYVMSPPLRERWNLDVLWRGLSSGDLQVVSTDHAPFFMRQKEMGKKNFSKIPNGVPGIETRIPLMYSEGVRRGRISLNQLVEICSTAPAKLMGMPQKGMIAPGSDADLVIFDPDKEVTLSHENLHQRTDYTPYEGMSVVGYPVKVIANGELLVDNGEFVGEKKRGKFIRREPCNIAGGR